MISFFSWFRIWFPKIIKSTWTLYKTKKLVSANLRSFEKLFKRAGLQFLMVKSKPERHWSWNCFVWYNSITWRIWPFGQDAFDPRPVFDPANDTWHFGDTWKTSEFVFRQEIYFYWTWLTEVFYMIRIERRRNFNISGKWNNWYHKRFFFI